MIWTETLPPAPTESLKEREAKYRKASNGVILRVPCATGGGGGHRHYIAVVCYFRRYQLTLELGGGDRTRAFRNRFSPPSSRKVFSKGKRYTVLDQWSSIGAKVRGTDGFNELGVQDLQMVVILNSGDNKSGD
ncbi:hypothetical protein PM082_014358 [Marasmius tenuissimus]|nr:hypothetical protein PM082_014358 [Marasmius tenuissimus]